MSEAIVMCACGQRNRIPGGATPAGKVVICGRCKRPLPDILDDCDSCDGSGEVDDDTGEDDSIPCQDCGGSGRKGGA